MLICDYVPDFGYGTVPNGVGEAPDSYNSM